MLYQTAKIENGEIKIVQTKVIEQSKLTGECFMIQFNGPSACTTCEYKDTDDCGGVEIRKTGQNDIGNKVPV